MSRYLPVIFTASIAIAFTACETTQTESEKKTEPSTVETVKKKKFTDENPDATPKPKVKSTPAEEAESAPVEVEPTVTPIPTPAVQDYPTASAVDGKPGFVKSPFGGSGIVDVRGYPPGTEVKDPYTGKVFLVP